MLALVAPGLALVAPAPAAAVVGGGEADPGEWPWQIALVVGREQWCGGSLVAPDLVLTAAHCTEGLTAGQIVALAGTVEFDRGGQRRSVATIHQHEGYDDVELRNDISLLELAEPFDLGEGVEVVALASPTESLAFTQEGDPAFITGFGATSESGSSSPRLLEAEVITYQDDRCTDLYAEDGDEIFGESQVCAGVDAGGIDACYGDSGGPLVVPAGGDGDAGWVQVGIVSWGAGCGRPLRPTVYTEVSAFADWLEPLGVTVDVGEEFEGGGARIPARGSEGKASRYPLAIEVDEFDGELRSVAVRLVGLSHRRPGDLDIWLVAPDGTTVTLLSDADVLDVGGGIDSAEVTLLQGAGPPSRESVAGDVVVVDPSDQEADDQWPGARPVADLGRLQGVDPEGEWQLLVTDDQRGASGSLDSWVLVLTPAP